MTTYTLTGGDLDEAEAAAAIAAVTLLLEAEGAAAVDAPQPEGGPAGWNAAARLIAQGLVPTRVPTAPRWGNVERLRLAGRGRGGIVGQ
jgi:hypothetical protein